jgi:hypothetical protein
MLDRLRQQRSHYDPEEFKQKFKQHKQILKIRSEYPEQYQNNGGG